MGALDAARLVPGLLVIAGAATLVFRKVDVRLVLLPAALLLGILGGKPREIARTFFATFADAKFIVPICCSMGFAYVLKLFECDRHLVLLLTRPLRRVRALLIPGAVLAGFLVNVPIISQASTAAAIGPVLIPLLLATGLSRATAGAALLLGASVGGELLNPGAPEYATVTEVVNDLVPGAPPCDARIASCGRCPSTSCNSAWRPPSSGSCPPALSGVPHATIRQRRPGSRAWTNPPSRPCALTGPRRRSRSCRWRSCS